jgi:hypothetical protein
MLFNIEADVGSKVVAYLVLDDFSAVPRIVVSAGGSEVEIEANETREALVTAGRHETGRCGFYFDKNNVPLITAPDLELYEPRSGVLIYRRRRPPIIDAKVFRLETHLLPMWRFDAVVARHFQYTMTRIEQYGRETTTQMFLMNNIKSQYISGYIQFKSFEYFINNGFSVWACVQRPYEELAERLLVLRNVRQVGVRLLSERDQIRLASTIEFAEQLPLKDRKALKCAFKNMPADIAAKLSNPLTRQLTVNDPDEMPTGGAIAASLDMLANCRLLGFRHAVEDFTLDAARLLDLPLEDTPPAGTTFPAAGEFARLIEETGAAESLLEKDLELFYYLAQAEKAARERENP